MRTATIPGFPDYIVTDLGEVINLKMRRRKLLGFTTKKGYQRVRLSREDGKHSRYIHRLVLMAFLGDPPPGTQAAHADGDPSNNRLDNLRWATSQENNQDKIQHGTAKGSGDFHQRLNALLQTI